jgi:putative zinc finger/helix-turn-helix YgiT family protein
VDRNCPKCGARVVANVRRLSQCIAGREFCLSVPFGRCKGCGTGYFDAAALERGERRIACRVAEDGPVDGRTLRVLRKALGLRASQLADVLSVTAETISRWETGQRRVDRSAWMVTSSLVLEKARLPMRTLARLEAAARPVPLEAVTIDTRPSTSAVDAPPRKRISGVVRRKTEVPAG